MCVLVAQSCPTLRDPMNCSPLGSSVREIFQARLLEWVAIPFSRRSSQSRNWTQVSWIAGRFFSIWATKNQRTWLWGRGLCGDMSIKGRLIWDDEFGAVAHIPSSPGISPRAPAKDRRALSSSGKQALSDLTLFHWGSWDVACVSAQSTRIRIVLSPKAGWFGDFLISLSPGGTVSTNWRGTEDNKFS